MTTARRMHLTPWRLQAGRWRHQPLPLLCLVLLTLVDPCDPKSTPTSAMAPNKLPRPPDHARWNVTCPRKCTCELLTIRQAALRAVRCANAKLQHLPQGAPRDLQALFLRGNVIDFDTATGITSPRQPMLKEYSHLTVLDLSYNRVTALHVSDQLIFANLSALEELDLSHNRLETLPADAFVGLGELRRLVLAGNHIHFVQPGALSGAVQLQELTLSDNNLESSSWLKENALPSLRVLKLDHNQLNVVINGDFTAQPLLEELDLNNNLVERFGALPELSVLWRLNLSGNRLAKVPSMPLMSLPRLSVLSLNDNPMVTVRIASFVDLAVSSLQLNFMSNLISVDKGAFQSLPNLTTLELHDNKRLGYIDPRAFKYVPNLRRLDLHNDNLQALPEELLGFLPSLATVMLANNPLQCDCNVHWIRASMQDSDPFPRNVTEEMTGDNTTAAPHVWSQTFPQADKFTCAGPEGLKDQMLKSIPLPKLPQTCPPKVVAFFNGSCQRELGSVMTYHCRAIGEPSPHIHWILSNGKIVNNTSNFSRIKLDRMGTLVIEHLKASDAGTYTCMAESSKGYDTATSVLRLHSRDIHVLQKGVATNFITVTWNGTGSTIATSDYLIMYRQKGTTAPYGRIHLEPYMRSYTITKLQPQTTYEFCIAYQHNTELVKLNCLDITTKHQMFVAGGGGIRTMGNLSVLIALSAVCIFIIFICLGMVLVRKCQRRKSYEEPQGSNSLATVATSPGARPGSSGPHKVAHMSQIPLDNIYHPPSTPLCTSRTSLITQSSVSTMSTA